LRLFIRRKTMKKMLLKLTVPPLIIALAVLTLASCSSPRYGRFYTVTFNSHREYLVESQIVYHGGTVMQPADPAPIDGYVFGGWYKDDGTFSTPWGFGVNAVTKDIMLYAKWLTQDEANVEDFGDRPVEAPITVTNKEEWIAALSAISTGGGNKNYVITVNDDSTVDPGNFGSNSWVKVSLRGPGVLTLGSNGALITVNRAQTLILRGPALKGKEGNTDSVVQISGSFIMKSGSISGNSAGKGGGVYIGGEDKGRFTMDGGTISGNSTIYGGGVYVDERQEFTMNGGTISGNSTIYGGGVYVKKISFFDMNGGTIRSNSASGYGGGVFVSRSIFDGNFIQTDGIFHKTGGIFTRNGGTIYGKDATTSNRNRAGRDGRGHAVYDKVTYRDITAGPRVSIDFSDNIKGLVIDEELRR
jgi:uncharacterized repeat protein (TIGR02543 family)